MGFQIFLCGFVDLQSCRLSFCLTELPHSTLLKGLTPVWINKCFVRLPFCVNEAPQVKHLYGFSSMNKHVPYKMTFQCK